MILFLSMFKQGFRKTLPSTRLGCCWTKASKMQSQKRNRKSIKLMW